VDCFLLIFAYTDRVMSRYDRPSHRVFMKFFLRQGWQVQLIGADLRTPLPRRFTCKDPEKIPELARRGDGNLRRSGDVGVWNRGRTRRCYLRLTPEQYRKLRRPGPGKRIQQ
jgi:hypothetical protein